MTELQGILEFVAEAVWHVWPWFLVSIVLSVLIRALKLDSVIRKAFNANVGKAILIATLVGAFSPFCSCTVVPVIAGLLLSGVPLAPIMSFWIASPTMDPEIFALSAGILGWPLALTRLMATLILSLAAGYLTLALTNRGWLRSVLPLNKSKPAPVVPVPAQAAVAHAQAPIVMSMSLVPAVAVTQPAAAVTVAQPAPALAEQVSCSSGICSATTEDLGRNRKSEEHRKTEWLNLMSTSFKQIDWPEFSREVARQSWILGRWVLLAFLMEALIVRYVPQESILTVLGKDNPLAVPLAALIGIPLYLNNFGALPIVSGLLAQGMQPGAAIAFLIAGPVTTIPAMTAVYGVVHKRVFALYLGLSLLGAMILGLLTNLILA